MIKDINGNLIEVGDVIMRAKHSDFTHHKVVRIADAGITVSSYAQKPEKYYGRLESYREDRVVQTPITRHNTTLYITNGFYSGRDYLILEKNNQTLDVTKLKTIQKLYEESQPVAGN